jgi:hypothetical protein
MRADVATLDEAAEQREQPHPPLVFRPVEDDEEPGPRAAADVVKA